MCMIGHLKWAVTLCRFDILAHVMSMSRFRLAPKIEHLEKMIRLHGIFQNQKTLQLDIGVEPKSQTTPTYENKNMIHLEQSVEMPKKKSQKTF